MSGKAVEPASAGPIRAHPDLTQGGSQQSVRHDSTLSAMSDTPGRAGDGGSTTGQTLREKGNVSTTQKMISASWGSLLTSVLGMPSVLLVILVIFFARLG